MDFDTRYNGWANWATWNAHIWISNDQGLYEEARELLTDYDYSASCLGDWFNGLIYEHVDKDAPAIVTDYLSASLDEIDWEEIWESLRQDFGLYDEDDECDEDDDEEEGE